VVGTAAPVPLPTVGVTPAAADHCRQHRGGDDSGTTVQVECPDRRGGDERDGNDRGGDDGGSPDGGINPAEACADYAGWDDCETVVALNGMHPDDICGYVVHPDQSLLDYYHGEDTAHLTDQEPAPPGAVLYYNICPREGVVYTEDTRWEPGVVAVPPTPAEVAEDLLPRVRARLDEPELQTSPDVGIPALLFAPTFVAVTNWQEEFEVSGCDTGVCVTLTATPALTFNPAEPGADAVACEAGGTRFRPDGPEPAVQASAPGACAHPYRDASLPCRRDAPGSTTVTTMSPSHPDQWQGVVTVTWTVMWEGAGEDGEFDPIPMSTDLPRGVYEMCTTVTDGDSGGRG
jgi:hypothetical protein